MANGLLIYLIWSGIVALIVARVAYLNYRRNTRKEADRG